MEKKVFNKTTFTQKVERGFRPSVYIGNDTVFCGKFLHTISTVKNFKSYLWNTGSTNYYITTSQSGNDYVSVLDSNSCKATDTISIESFNRPKFSYYSDSLNCKYMFYNVLKFYLALDRAAPFSDKPSSSTTAARPPFSHWVLI